MRGKLTRKKEKKNKIQRKIKGFASSACAGACVYLSCLETSTHAVPYFSSITLFCVSFCPNNTPITTLSPDFIRFPSPMFSFFTCGRVQRRSVCDHRLSMSQRLVQGKMSNCFSCHGCRRAALMIGLCHFFILSRLLEQTRLPLSLSPLSKVLMRTVLLFLPLLSPVILFSSGSDVVSFRFPCNCICTHNSEASCCNLIHQSISVSF